MACFWRARGGEKGRKGKGKRAKGEAREYTEGIAGEEGR